MQAQLQVTATRSMKEDVDRSQLRLALLLAAPANRIFLVGDDDQTYSKSLPGWTMRPSDAFADACRFPHQGRMPVWDGSGGSPESVVRYRSGLGTPGSILAGAGRGRPSR